ncbi:type II toxin-antitoxin system VapC family toxin [Pseudanabaena yagii]|nr:PIN domain-containing protein [Pseudanabaena yagii]
MLNLTAILMMVLVGHSYRAMKYIIDTHALIWFLEGNSRLGAIAKEILSDASSELILPAIALAESAWIVSRGKTSIPSVEALLKVVKDDERVSIYPLDFDVIERSIKLISINEMHDRQIVSTALVIESQGNQVAILTCDQNICEAKAIATVW